jgi:hypothetical protein
MKSEQLRQIIREEIQTVLAEGLPQDRMVKGMIAKIIKEYGFSEEDAVFFLMHALKRLKYIKNFEV